MSKRKNSVDATVKRSKNERWNVAADGVRLGQVDSLCDATDLLYDAGYKVYAYRRQASASGKSGFIATCIKFKKEVV
jgi:hypothetical protein